MFDLNRAINDWRRGMSAGGLHGAEVLDELEAHLRDDVDGQVALGASSHDAFLSATRHLGNASELRIEFKKLIGTRERMMQMKRAFLTLAGIPADVSSKAVSQIEPRWATYVKAAFWLLPAAVIWTFSVIFVFPKLQQICKLANVQIPGIYHLINAITDNPLFICLGVLGVLLLLEWRSSAWPRYRRATLGLSVFLFNTAVLLLISAMVVLALLAAPALMPKA